MPRILNITEEIKKLKGSIPYKSFSMKRLGFETPNFLPVQKLPGYVTLSFLLTEDALFFKHHAINWRALWHRQLMLFRGESGKGSGSSITQQLMKLAFFKFNRGILGKLLEVIYAKRAEVIFSKDEILGLYLSSVRLSKRSLGVLEGAKYYYGKSPDVLTLSESIFLAYSARSPTAIEESVLKREYLNRFEEFMRIKLFDVFGFYVYLFGIDSLFSFERYSYNDIKVALEKCSPSHLLRGLSACDLREIEWLVLDHVKCFRDWFFSFEPQQKFDGGESNASNIEKEAAPLSV